MLNSPRGRDFCANIGFACSNDERKSGYNRQRTPSDVLDDLANVDVRAIAQLSEIEMLDELAGAVDVARYWQPPDEDDLIFAAPEVITVLRPIAQAILESPHTSWWTESVDLVNQRVVQKFESIPDSPAEPLRIRHFGDGLERWHEHMLDYEAQFVEYVKADPDRNIGGEWWSIPAADGVYDTTRERDGVGAMELMLEEDSPGWGYPRVWPVRVHGAPRVYEITCPADWAHLVDAYPLAVPASRRFVWHDTTGEHHNWFVPDWTAVVTDYDAVHLTMVGYLTTPGIAIPLTEHSGATVLAGWNPDVTYWLCSDFITIGDTMTEWRRSLDGPWVEASSTPSPQKPPASVGTWMPFR
ncbi:hypothetical protein [Rhodococcus sp. IEGM 1379]|uniref:hypothetical protein n=1 Tax=Rhodococcus sp. IEGM 1379 TaxID=3047086 RepID=UPI0024B76F1C|nr:hypothetical protein [Rhodococcus sp. IEGM 1379]MDI9913767.1 hypothetical protein [Rhodococcus sp. IEGM 1379]